MNRKLLFFDIDGTLLYGSDPGYIPESALDALRKAQENGHYVLINTGRTWAYLPRIIKEYPFDGYLCGCGTYVILHDQILCHHTVPGPVSRAIPELLREYDLQGVMEGVDHMYIDLSIEPFVPLSRIMRNCELYGKDIVRDFTDEELAFHKFAIIGESLAKIEDFRDELKDHFTYIGPTDLGTCFFAEFIPNGYSKATAIDLITSAANLSTDDCYVFGDGVNDLPMMRHVKHSIAMGNSSPFILSSSSYITTPVNRDGIRNAMLHFGLISSGEEA